jgi:flagellar assembly protein FliH
MGTLLRGSAPPARRVEAPLLAASERARALLAGAEAEASLLLASARADAEAIRLAARDEGRQQGLAEASGRLAAAAAERDRQLARAAPELVELALAIARRVVGAAAEREAGLAVDAAARVLSEARARTRVALHVHPADAAEVRRSEPRLAAALEGKPFALVEDEGVGRCGARVVSEAGTIEARLEAQLEALRRVLLDEAAR